MLPHVATSSHRWKSGDDTRTVQELLGHADRDERPLSPECCMLRLIHIDLATFF